jgi:4-hydroxy-2-oxoheptanedioate aldolase
VSLRGRANERTAGRPVTFSRTFTGDRAQIGLWVSSGSAYCAEICAGAGLDWLLIDAEHSPNDLVSLLSQLQAVAAYPVHPVVRPPVVDPVLIKQLLDLGAQNLLMPMVDSVEAARAAVEATRYPPRGVRGVGSALARASRWNRIDGYVGSASDDITVLVQVESRAGLDALEEIATEDGIDGVFIGPADLAASLGHLGEPEHPEVVVAIEGAIATLVRLGKAAGVNAFGETRARRYIELGCRFIAVGADVSLLARGSEELAVRYGAGPGSGA